MKGNLFAHRIPPAKGEITETLCSTDGVKIQKILSSDRLEQRTFLQTEAEWVTLLEGSAEIMMEGIRHRLERGDYLFIPPATEHTITRVEKGTLWLAVHIGEKETK